jgi:hypothetical protein
MSVDLQDAFEMTKELMQPNTVIDLWRQNRVGFLGQ